MAQGSTRAVPIDIDGTLANNSDLLVPSQKAVVTYVTSGLSSKQNALGFTPLNRAGDTMLGNLLLSSNPTSALQAATKDYVDTLINGVDWKQSAVAGTVAALPAYTVSGSGTILTGNANGAIPSATTDGIVLAVTNRVLVKNETSTLTPNNGIYVVTQVGNGSTPFILTRSDDANSPTEIAEATISIYSGSTLSNTQWHCNPASVPVVFGTTYITFAQIGSGVYTSTAPISITGNIISISQATTSTNGYLSSTDWNTFNNKQPQLNGTGFVKISGTTISYDNSTYYLASNPSGYTSNTGTVTSVAALTLGTSGTDLSSTVANGTTTPVITLNVPTASATNRGALSSTDWTTFNNKQNALTNPVTGTGTINELAYFNATGSTIASLSTATYPSLTELSYVKGVTSAIQTQINSKQASSTNLTSLSGLTFASTSFVKMTAAGTFGLDTNTYLTANQSITLSSDVTGSGTTAITATIAAGAVTLAKMANLAANSIIGNNTGVSATPLALTGTQVTAMLDTFSTSATTKGLVTGSNGVGATYYLNGNGGWSVPASSGMTNPMTLLGDMIYGGASGTPTRLIGQTTTAKQYLSQTGTGTISAIPAWATIAFADISGTLSISAGGTGQTTAVTAFDALAPTTTLGDTIYHNGTDNVRLAGNITTTKQFLSQTGTGTISAIPSWSAVTKTDVGLGSVENTALSTWAGSTNITTLGTIATGTWSGTAISAIKGGTGQTGYAIGDLLYADTTTSLAKLADVATGNALISGGVGVAPSWGKIGLTTHVSGTLAIGNGGTGTTTAPTQGGIIFATTTSAFASSAQGTANQVLLSGGTGSPTWANQSTLSVGTATNIAGGLVNQINYQTGAGATSFITAPTTASTYLSWNGTAFAWAAVSGSGITSLNGLTGSTQTFTNDTNITITSAGTAHAIGWAAGTSLAVGRGGTGATTLTGVVTGNGTSALTAIAGTSTQYLRRNAANSAYEFISLTPFNYYNITEVTTAGSNNTVSFTTSNAELIVGLTSFTIPASSIAIGKRYRVTVFGTYTTNTNNTAVTASIIVRANVSSTTPTTGSTATIRTPDIGTTSVMQLTTSQAARKFSIILDLYVQDANTMYSYMDLTFCEAPTTGNSVGANRRFIVSSTATHTSLTSNPFTYAFFARCSIATSGNKLAFNNVILEYLN